MFIDKCFLLFFLVIISFLCSATIEARPTYLYHNCSTAGKTFSANSTFQSHRTTLLSSLASANASFHNTTVPGGSDTIYGLFMCRGDVSLQVCNQCVVNATQRLPSECPFSKEAVIWYDECMLRYSNISFFSTIDKWPIVVILNPNNISDSFRAGFRSFLLSFMNETASKVAAVKPEAKAYAKNQANFESQTVYSLAQCTPDLPLQDCRSCLSGVIRNIPLCSEGKTGGRAVNPSCNIRYELFSFFDSNQLNAPTPAPALAPTLAPALAPTTPRLDPFFPRTNSSHHPPPRPPGKGLNMNAFSSFFLFFKHIYQSKL